jgi:hypothetical protein
MGGQGLTTRTGTFGFGCCLCVFGDVFQLLLQVGFIGCPVFGKQILLWGVKGFGFSAKAHALMMQQGVFQTFVFYFE